jgi:hypothetical protein
MYEGGYKDLNPDGLGTYTHPDGKKYEGGWKDKKLWNGTEYDKNGIIIGKYLKGENQK